MKTALPLPYQTGHLTIKGYDRESGMYALGIPNNDVGGLHPRIAAHLHRH